MANKQQSEGAMGRRVLTCALAVAMVWAAGVVVPLRVPVAGDTNGDQRVDVLDLQRIVASVLADGAYDPRADVNGDGRVDILDFQLALAQTHAGEHPPLPRQKDRHLATVTTRFVPPVVSAIHLFITPGKRVTTAALRAPSVPQRSRSARTERYTYMLTPHAPPAGDRCVCS